MSFHQMLGLTISSFAAQSGQFEESIRISEFQERAQVGVDVTFASDVDLDGWNDLLIGLPGFDSGGIENSGAARLYSGKTQDLIHEFGGNQVFGFFGTSVTGGRDVNGDGVADIAIGTAGEFPIASVYVYSGSDGLLIRQHSGFGLDDSFGRVVDIRGDFDNDGHADVLSSAILNDPGGRLNAGTVIAFSGLDGSVLHQIDGPVGGEWTGRAVAAVKDLDGDDVDDFLFSDFTTGNRGSVHVYSGLTGTFLYRLDGQYVGDYFGTAMDGVGDLDNDGLEDFIVGASDAAVSGEAGAAYVYSGGTGILLFELWGIKQGDDFGRDVVGLGDINGDRVPDFAVGSPEWSESRYVQKGSVFVYSGIDGSQLGRLNGFHDGNDFGYALASPGDINLDGRNDILIGAPGEDDNGINATGAAYVYSYDPFLTPSAITISDTTGGSVTYEHHFPLSEAGMNYWLLASTSREGTFIKNGVEIPLANTGLLHRSANNPMPFVQNAVGVLDQNAQATSVLTWAPGKASAYVGRTFALASVTYDSSGQIRLSSGKALLRVLP